MDAPRDLFYDPMKQIYDKARHDKFVKDKTNEELDLKFSLNPQARNHAELDAIKQQAIANGTFMKASNGKPTNLNEKQWLQVRTKAFKKWFGDWENDAANASKVVDENGEPLVVYHGTNWKALKEKPGDAAFKNSFVKNTSEGVGFYFTKDKNLASGYGEPVACFLNLKNPKYAKGDLLLVSEEEIKSGEVKNVAEENKARIAKAVHNWKREMESKGWEFYDEIDSGFLNILNGGTVEQVLDDLLSADGFIKQEEYDSDKFAADVRDATVKVFVIDGYVSEKYGNGAGAYVAFRSEQIKSATDNTGTFDSENADIRYSLAQQANNQAVDEIESVRERVEADGIKYSLIAYHGGIFDFEKPLREFRGKGEGAAAHGAGFYAALSKDVSKGYAERLVRQTINGVDRSEAITNFVREFLKNNGYERGSSWDADVAEHFLIRATNGSIGYPNRILEEIEIHAKEGVEGGGPLFGGGARIVRELKDKYAEHFLKSNLIATLSRRVLHTVSLPDNNGFNYLREENPITDEQRTAIEKEFEKTYGQGKKLDGFGISKDEIGRSVYKSIVKEIHRIERANGNDIFIYSSKELASDLLHRAGIIGIRYKGGLDGECAVMFDENDVEVIDIERWSLARELSAETMNEEPHNGKLSLNMEAPRDLFYDPMGQIYDKARHDKFVKDKTNEELEALNTAATNYDSLLKIAKQAITLACWQVRNKRDNAPNWVINRLTKHLNDAERAIAVERAQMTYEIIKNRYGEIPNLSAENAITAEEIKENYKRVAVAQAKIRYARMQESFNEYYEKARVKFQRPDNKDVVKLSRDQKSQLDKHIDALTQLTAWNEDMKKAELEKARKLADKPIEPENTNKESEKETDEEKQKEISPEEKKAIAEKVNANIDILMVDLANIVAKNTLSQDTRENFDTANLENSYSFPFINQRFS